MEITAFIKELLFGHDCVIIPGFGGFIGNYTPAHIDKSSGVFYPPVKQISFNRNLNHNDGLLTGKISEMLKVNYGDAKSMVENFVADIRSRLNKGEKVNFDNIGSFINNQEGNVQFEPDSQVNYYLNSYGLESFECMPLEQYDVRKRVIQRFDKGAVFSPSMKKILWRAAVIVPLLSVLIAVPFKTEIFKSKVEATTMNPLVTAEFENNRKAVDETVVIPEKEAETIVNSTVSQVAPVNTGSYFLITGSFKSEQNANMQVEMLKKEGFEPEVISTSNGFFRVSAMKCSSLNAAVNSKETLLKNFPGTWVKKN